MAHLQTHDGHALTWAEVHRLCDEYWAQFEATVICRFPVARGICGRYVVAGMDRCFGHRR